MNDSIHSHIQTRLLVIASACHERSAADEPYASMQRTGLLPRFPPSCK